ncbi:MAG: GIY-YIG nuclease family protein [Chlorobi bacterium]|nr:GIY-YIG nuclease family protein [Chlorobiota bacterium]
MPKFFVYILQSEKFGNYYVGHTDNVEKRVKEHNSIDNKSYTSRYQPWILKRSFFVGNDRGVAMRIERFIKKQKSRKFIEKVIEDPYQIDFIVQLVRVPRPRD